MIGTFEDKPAVRETTPIILALTSPSGGGKTVSALRIATGICDYLGEQGKIFLIDTEGGRSLHYAPAEGEPANPAELTFHFQIVPFRAPYGSLRYLEAIDRCISKGAAVIITDSLSHEHEGEGGYLDLHASEVERLVAKGWSSAEKAEWPAWKVPAQNRQKLLNRIRTLNVHFIFCFRAKDKSALGKEKGGSGREKTIMVRQGWLPIGGADFIYETQISLVFEPMADGIPVLDLASLTPDQRIAFKMEKPFRKFFKKPEQLTEELGRSLAAWSTGGKKLPASYYEHRAEQAQHAEAQAPQAKPAIRIGPDISEPCGVCKNNVPRCAACKMIMVFRPEGFAYKSQTEIVRARWACPNPQKNCKPPSGDKRRSTNIWAEDWHAILESREPQKPPAAMGQARYPD